MNFYGDATATTHTPCADGRNITGDGDDFRCTRCGWRESSRTVHPTIIADLNQYLRAATVMALDRFPNKELAALNLGVDFGAVPEGNAAREMAEKAGLLDDSGRPRDAETLKSALACVVNQRVDRGDWP